MNRNKINKQKVVYTDEPIKLGRRVTDFLPSPEELARKDSTKKITISLFISSVDFFKKEAKRHRMQYQKMIRTVLDEYAKQKSRNL